MIAFPVEIFSIQLINVNLSTQQARHFACQINITQMNQPFFCHLHRRDTDLVCLIGTENFHQLELLCFSSYYHLITGSHRDRRMFCDTGPVAAGDMFTLSVTSIVTRRHNTPGSRLCSQENFNSPIKLVFLQGTSQ